ncbi:MarR family winged helix-turn-helix transcriptional regulator [Aurantimonas sp. MSK8Z-1]|uniref:MarR family winged helix-turn-helix transcriptional regulator n=1 Tax=Mangrovibrevibacter kandeliae TaxID=2968473 RepID=UPI0021186237|nr:MarR family winged helix-turn-helix transcriptional regulator [Aurantimonas sp. MSK8Z-1]MCW4114932.1 MarR family winged helix-turn-helix transcriptional regulator [Aurantimonas sp. MSK8Z-1]
MSINKVQSAHIRENLPDLHRSLIDIVSEMNRPERDEQMLAAAGLSLERALFPLLVLVERLGPIGVVDLASRVGRDYTTVSRQVARLDELGLVTRRAGTTDRRVREAIITPQGRTATDAVDAARERMAQALFADWSRKDFDDLSRLLRMLADGLDGPEVAA